MFNALHLCLSDQVFVYLIIYDQFEMKLFAELFKHICPVELQKVDSGRADPLYVAWIVGFVITVFVGTDPLCMAWVSSFIAWDQLSNSHNETKT